DTDILKTPNYGIRKLVYQQGEVFRFPDSTHVQFKCTISVCDRGAGDCDILLPPKCGQQTRSKRGNLERLPKPNFAAEFTVETSSVYVLDDDSIRGSSAQNC